jgi:ubiquitin carboxyl-terminal hydrolase 8
MVDVLQNILGDFVRLFDGQIATHLTCMGCKKERTTKESFIDLSVPLTSTSVLDSLRSTFGTHEILEDPIECEKCSASTKTFKSVTIARLPKILAISLINPTKSVRGHIDEILTITDGDNAVHYASYVLTCVIYHIGNFNGGHYYCNVRNNGKWLHIDDTNIQEIPSYSQNTTSAYVLVYEKASTIA